MGNFFKSLASWFLGLFKAQVQAIAGFFKPLIADIQANYGDILLGIVQGAVVAAEAVPSATGAQKMGIAFKAVVTALEAKGQVIVENAIRGAIEASVAALPKEGLKK